MGPAAPPQFCYFRDQRPLSEQQLERARAALDTVRGFFHGRDSRDDDLAFTSPSALWRRTTSFADRLIEGDRDALERLRLLSWPFSGVSLLNMTAQPKAMHATPDCDDPDAVLSGVAARGVTAEMQHALTAAVKFAGILPITLPDQMGEVGWRGPHGVVNLDTIAFAERMAILAEFGVVERLMQPAARPVVVEIGGGFGGLALILTRSLPGLRYVIVDLPESLAFSAAYLSAMRPDATVAFLDGDSRAALPESFDYLFVPHYAWRALVAALGRADIGLNTLSFAEMTAPQVDAYGQGLASLLGRNGLLFEQNFDDRRRGGLEVSALLNRHFEDISPRQYGPMLRGVPRLWRPRAPA